MPQYRHPNIDVGRARTRIDCGVHIPQFDSSNFKRTESKNLSIDFSAQTSTTFSANPAAVAQQLHTLCQRSTNQDMRSITKIKGGAYRITGLNAH